MTAQLSPSPIFRAWDPNGLPLSYGKLYSYAAGTTTKIATYIDSTEDTPNTNPVILSAFGTCALWLDPTLTYKFVLTDSVGNTMPGYPVDNIPGGFGAGGFSGNLIPNPTNTYTLGSPTNSWAQLYLGPNEVPVFDLASGNVGYYAKTAAEIAASVTPVNYGYAPFDIRRYGGDSSGTSFSDTALASAISVCGGAGGGVIRLPAGTYKFANQINLSNTTGIILQGDSTETAGAQPATRMAYTGLGSSWILGTSAIGLQFKNLQLVHLNSGFFGIYINLQGTVSFPSGYCGVFDCVIGNSVSTPSHLNLDKSLNFTCERCVFISWGAAGSVQGAISSSSFSNVVAFRGVTWPLGSGTSAPVQGGGQTWLFEGVTFEALANGGAGGILSTGGAPFDGLAVKSCWFGDVQNGTQSGVWIDVSGSGFEFSGNYMSGFSASDTTTGINLSAMAGVGISGNVFSGLEVAINFPVAGSSAVVVQGNVFNAVTSPFVNANNVVTGQLVWLPNFGVSEPPSSNHGSLTSDIEVNPITGRITQRGLFSSASHGSNSVSFGMTFPNACQNVICTLSAVSSTAATIYASSLTTTGFTAYINDGTSTTDSFYWEASGY